MSRMFTWEGVGRLGRLVRKELLEILRDRRTILTLVLMPVLLYPLLTVAFQQFILASKVDPSQTQEYHLGFANAPEGRFFMEVLEEGADSAEQPVAGKKKPSRPPTLKPWFPDPVAEPIPTVEDMVRNGEVDVGIRLPAPPPPGTKPQDFLLQAEVIYFPNSAAAQGVLAYLDRVFARRNIRLLESQLNVPSDRPPMVVLKLQRSPLKDAAPGPVVSLSALVPLILILMTITGAVYPAIDLTAGERERGTLEILVAAPVPRLGLLFAKYVSVLTVAVMTALVNLLTMTITLNLSGMGHLLFPEGGGWTLAVIVQMFGLLLLFAGFFSAVLLCLTSFARSFKEAQAYLIPLMLASLAPGLMGMIPGLKLENLAFAPLINIVLLARDLFESRADPVSALLVVVSTVLYALAALALAARIFGAEGVLYSEQSSWSDLFRRPREEQPAASGGAALICLALMIPGTFLLQSTLRIFGLPPVTVLTVLPVATGILFAGLPLASACLGRVNIREGFALRRPPVLALGGGLLLGLALWPFVLQLLLHWLAGTLEPSDDQVDEALKTLRAAGQSVALSLGLVALAEEFFFRGYLFGALARTNHPAVTIGLTSLLFGLMHCLVPGGLGFAQLLPATLLGLILGTIRWHTGSVLPGMVLHATHNVLLMLWLLSEQVKSWEDHVPTEYLMLGAVGTALGAGLIFLSKRRGS